MVEVGNIDEIGMIFCSKPWKLIYCNFDQFLKISFLFLTNEWCRRHFRHEDIRKARARPTTLHAKFDCDWN